jgi:general stress protein 26
MMKSHTSPHQMNDIQYFAKLIKDIKFAMLTTVDVVSGQLESRPMTLQQVEFDGDLWFFASRAADFVRHIEFNPSVNLAFSNPEDFSFLSAKGSAQVVFDPEKAEELWNPMCQAWFPQGLADPNLCLLKVSVESADYWKTPESKFIRLVGFAKAILTGQKANQALGQHGHLNIS